jgi:phosphatidylglycerol---prolipoprotein diacylglyceryl transferase
LPWAVQFPSGSVPFEAEVARGLIFENAATTRALHPTQIYSSVNALVLAILTWNYFPYRQRDGAVLAVGWVAYPLSRFTIEFLRNDLGGQWGTPFTPAQLFSFAMLGSGLLFLWYIMRQPPRVIAANRAEGVPQLTKPLTNPI